MSPIGRLALALVMAAGLAAVGRPALAQALDATAPAAEKVGEPVVVTPIAKPPFRGVKPPPKGVGEVAAVGQPGSPGQAHAAGDKTAPAGEGLKNSRTAALVFWLFAVGTIGGALFVITRSNLVTAVMGMVGTFFALAGLFLMLYASFLAVIQVLVYAGAIMVLFVFVVMILNRPEDEPWALQGLLGKALAGVAIAYLVLRLGGILWDLKDTQHAVIAAPRPVLEITAGDPGDFGSVRAVGNTLFRDYLFPFEAVSLVLLAAVVGAIAVARPHHKDEPEEAA